MGTLAAWMCLCTHQEICHELNYGWYSSRVNFTFVKQSFFSRRFPFYCVSFFVHSWVVNNGWICDIGIGQVPRRQLWTPFLICCTAQSKETKSLFLSSAHKTHLKYRLSLRELLSWCTEIKTSKIDTPTYFSFLIDFKQYNCWAIIPYVQFALLQARVLAQATNNISVDVAVQRRVAFKIKILLPYVAW